MLSTSISNNGVLVVAERISLSDQQEFTPLINERLRRLAEGLDASARVKGFTGNGFTRIQVEGSDSEVLTELIRRKLNVAAEDISQLEVDDHFKAYVKRINPKKQSLEVEIGPLSAHVKCEINEHALAAQLSDGRMVPIERTARTYCLHEGVPILTRITEIDRHRRQLQAWISDDQMDRFENWRRQRFHRILAIGDFRERICRAIRFSGVERDVIDIEELAFTTSCLVCKLGTEAPGIIAKIGRHIGKVRLHVFLPERLDEMRTSSETMTGLLN